MGALATKLNVFFKSFESEPSRVIMLGLDAAGKTTLLYQMKLGQVVKTIPTIGFNVEKVTVTKGLTLTVWDVGGQDKLRRLWKHYYQEATGLVFVVDSADPARFKEAQDELSSVVEDPLMSQVPVLVLANKQDMDCARPVELLTNEMEMKTLLQNHPWHIQACCALKGEGIIEGMQEFSKMLKDQRKRKNP